MNVDQTPPCLPVLPVAYVQHAATIIQTLYSPSAPPSIEQQHLLQKTLSDVQKTPEAWGLIVPLFEYDDGSVQFFGAHTAQIKIARDWDSFPSEQVSALKDTLLDLTGRACATGKDKVAIRKLFVTLVNLAVRIAPLRNSQWQDWVLSSIAALSGRGASAAQVLEFLSIVAEEASQTDFLGTVKMTFNQSLTDSIPLMLDAVENSCTSVTASASEKEAAFKCLLRWVEWGMPGDALTRCIPLVISALSSAETFIPASDVLQEILTASSMADGKGTNILTEPLLSWLETTGRAVLAHSISSGDADDTTHSLGKLLVALGEHSNEYLARNILDARVQNFLDLVMGFTNFPGTYVVDEEESEIALPFWFLLQEGLVDSPSVAEPESKEWELARQVFNQLVTVLRKKAAWPVAPLSSDQREKFRAYRRDVGDALINAYYILRDDMMKGLIDLLYAQIRQPDGPGHWEDVESTLHVIRSIQEAVSLEEQENLPRLWSAEVINPIASSPDPRVRQTMLGAIGAYSSWFPKKDPSTVIMAASYVLNSLSVPAASLAAASTLKELCDSNRSVLAQNSLDWFANLYAQLDTVPESEKGKVLESITSVIQALPMEEAVAPVTAVVTPLVTKLFQALNASSQHPEEARLVCISQLKCISACAKGLTESHDFLSDLINPDDEDETVRRQRMQVTRKDEQLVQLRAGILEAVQGCFSLWSTNAEIADALSDLLRAITGLTADETLISLEPEPLLMLVCAAAERELTAVWLSLAQILTTQLDPKKFLWIRPVADPQSLTLVRDATLSLINTAVRVLGGPGAMEANTDLVQEFFGSCMNAIAMHFIVEMYKLPPEALNSLIAAAVRAMALAERYCVVSAARFLQSFIDMTLRECTENAVPLNKVHGYSILATVLHGIAFRAPRSTVPNLAELLAILSSKFAEDTREWVRIILFSDDFSYPKATPAVKETFMKALARHRRIGKVKDAANEFSLVVRGLEGSSFGYASSAA